MRKCTFLLSKLSVEESQAFFRWLEAELAGRQAPVLQLLSLHLQGKTEEESWQVIFPDLPFDSQELGRKFGQLLVHLEEFLAIQSFRKDRMLRDRVLLKRLNELRLGDEFLKYVNKVRRRLHQSGRGDKEYYANLHALERELLQHYLVQKVPPKRRLALNSKETFFRWWSHTFLFTRILEKVRKTRPLNGLTEEWEDKLTEQIYILESHRADPVLSLYRRYDQLLDEKEEDLYGLLDQLKEHQFKVPWDIRYNLFAILFNYVSRKQRTTKEDRYFFLRLKLETVGIEEKWMFVGKHLSARAYKNHISLRNTCLFMIPKKERSDWLEETWNFLEEYREHLMPYEREEAYYFNRLQMYFFSGESYHFLLKRKFGMFSDPHNEIDFRILTLMARFEAKDLYGIETNVKSVWQYIHIQSEKKVRTPRKKAAFEYIKLFRALLRASSQQDWRSLEDQVQLVSREAKQGWFMDQVQQHLQEK